MMMMMMMITICNGVHKKVGDGNSLQAILKTQIGRLEWYACVPSADHLPRKVSAYVYSYEVRW